MAYKHIGVTAKSGLDDKDAILSRIADVAVKEGIELHYDQERLGDCSTAKNLHILSKDSPIDALLVIGGDGTIIRAVRELKNPSIPILSIDRGSVGFMAEVALSELESVLPLLFQEKGIFEERTLLRASVVRNGEELFEGYALNEIVIAQGAIARLLNLQTNVDGEDLATFHADGLIIATPTGSTAYSLAAGGPIVHPRLPATILTPINPHSFTQKPIVIPGTQNIDVEIVKKPNMFLDSEVGLTVDGQVYFPLEPNDHVVCCTHSETVKFLRREQDTFFSTLRRKLKWGSRLEE